MEPNAQFYPLPAEPPLKSEKHRKLVFGTALSWVIFIQFPPSDPQEYQIRSKKQDLTPKGLIFLMYAFGFSCVGV